MVCNFGFFFFSHVIFFFERYNVVFFFATGKPQEIERAKYSIEVYPPDDGCPFKTYNCDASNCKFFQESEITEIIFHSRGFAPVECGCVPTEAYFHDDECDEGLEPNDVIVRLKSGKFARVYALGCNPRDYNGCAIWVSSSLEELLKADIDAPLVR